MRNLCIFVVVVCAVGLACTVEAGGRRVVVCNSSGLDEKLLVRALADVERHLGIEVSTTNSQRVVSLKDVHQVWDASSDQGDVALMVVLVASTNGHGVGPVLLPDARKCILDIGSARGPAGDDVDPVLLSKQIIRCIAFGLGTGMTVTPRCLLRRVKSPSDLSDGMPVNLSPPSEFSFRDRCFAEGVVYKDPVYIPFGKKDKP